MIAPFPFAAMIALIAVVVSITIFTMIPILPVAITTGSVRLNITTAQTSQHDGYDQQ